MPADAQVTLREGESAPVYGTVTAPTGTVSIIGTPTVTLYDSARQVVSGYDGIPVDGFTADELEEVRAWLIVEGLTAGEYRLAYVIVTIGSDSIPRKEEPIVELTIEPVPGGGPRAAYPGTADLAAAIRGLGLFDADELPSILGALDLAGAMRSAVAEWERRTGWTPFLAAAEDTEDDIPDCGLRRGLVAVTSVQRLTHDSLGAEVLGTPLVANVGYRLFRAYPRLPLAWTIFRVGTDYTYRITGRWGVVTELPDDVWSALICGGLLQVTEALGTRISGGLQAMGDVRVGADPLERQAARWQAKFDSTVIGYRRIPMSL